MKSLLNSSDNKNCWTLLSLTSGKANPSSIPRKNDEKLQSLTVFVLVLVLSSRWIKSGLEQTMPWLVLVLVLVIVIVLVLVLEMLL